MNQKQLQRIYIEQLIQQCQNDIEHADHIGKRIALSIEAKRHFYQLGATFKLFMSDIGETFGLDDMVRCLPQLSKGTIQRLFFTKDAYHFNSYNLTYALNEISIIADTSLYPMSDIEPLRQTMA